MTILITGAGGHIGRRLVDALAARGETVVAVDIIDLHRTIDRPDLVTFRRGSVANMSEVLDVMKTHRIERIFHLGAMLSVVSESNHWESHQINVQGTMNVLEASRILGVKQVFFASSRGTYGLDTGDVVDDFTVQRPTLFYGSGKLYGEGVGRWYRAKFGLDFRALRYPTMMAPGVRTAGHWAPLMIEDAIQGRAHVAQASPSDLGAFLHVSDAVRGTLEIMNAPAERVGRVVYNLAGIQNLTSALEMEAALVRRFPEFTVKYERENGPRATYSKFSDSQARHDWGWRPEIDDLDKLISAFEKIVSRSVV
ncbi:NAD-dependent epimerase/dehydratase family protein [Methylobacterium terricola]|uniref:NAD-dependent epimerase/dehydratase family protein n=1 Tax=Methylobacterium terricola TaxID=2583531 RepID=A0A5C4L9X9_9HYPH|nr:NAD-dependent epimerase/dehydratase family protein [Methylobacterium terricola]TNC08177.1 NAD-dependent epimerase/dehydratase family protein [Methylobacterium terricola]